MIVTFISQCEKNSISKTRRILDSFANRIGDKTWQTVITQDGLDVVKKLLKKTASRSTAVSCHVMKARNRSELIWVVGRKQAFNSCGLVPVNYTSKEVIMDKLPMSVELITANTYKQPLIHHLFAVGYVAYSILEKLKIGSIKLKQSALLSGILHDIGKIDPEFQRWVKIKNNKFFVGLVPEDGVHIDTPKKFSFEKHPRHQELSWMLSEAILSEANDLSKSQLAQIAHSIYWHHTKPFRKEDNFTDAEKIFAIFNASLSSTKFYEIYDQAWLIVNEVAKLAHQYGASELIPKFSKKFELTEKNLPVFKRYDSALDDLGRYKEDVRYNALNDLVRASVISADRLVSSYSANDLNQYIVSGSLCDIVDSCTPEEGQLISGINNCLMGFEKKIPSSNRDKAQKEAAKKLSELQKFAAINESPIIGVLQGPAGCGKTKIALEWAKLTSAKNIIWICPRVQICIGLLHDLSSSEYLPDCKIEIFTGEYKKTISDGASLESAQDTDEDSYFSGDIVITTIDQVVNSITTHHKVTTLIDMMQAHVIFDEFHELINMPAFNLLFAELIEIKKAQNCGSSTLLVSATPHYFFLKNFLDIHDRDIISIDSFNNSHYCIEFKVFNEKEVPSPLISEAQKENTFIISNTAIDAQLGYIRQHFNENSILIHSKYTKQDKIKWFNLVFDSFRQYGSHQFSVLRSGPIIQASLNISCFNMLTELTCAENWLQRLGRLDRFGTNPQVNHYTTVLPESIEKWGKQTSNCARFLNQLCTWNSTKEWFNFLRDKLKKNEVNLNQLYKIYREFYTHPEAHNAIKKDFLLALKNSVRLINSKIIDPISILPKTKKDNGPIKISGRSLRGENRFVQMAVCKITEKLDIEFLNDYAYNEDFDCNMPQANLTESIDSMRGYGVDNKNLVQYMHKKHHNIKPDIEYKQLRNEWDLIKKAQSPESPIYLSYTPKDLDLIGGSKAAHSQAVYYVISEAQPIGAMSINHIKQAINNDLRDE